MLQEDQLWLLTGDFLIYGNILQQQQSEHLLY